MIGYLLFGLVALAICVAVLFGGIRMGSGFVIGQAVFAILLGLVFLVFLLLNWEALGG